jgi:hypothetical protein
MFRKIHSNRDPGDTVYAALKNEFAVYFGKAGNCGREFTERFPKILFGAMIFCIVVSVALSVTVFRKPPPIVKPEIPAPAKKPPEMTASPLSNGFSEVLRTGSALSETITLKKEVDSITAKKTLSNADSAVLLKDLDRLQQINTHFKQMKP